MSDSEVNITEYERFNSAIGGDSLRYCNRSKCSGWIKDFYPNGKLKHKGFYEDGSLKTVYRNYYETGEPERLFKAMDTRKCIMKAYFRNGKIKSEVLYYRGEPILWQDFYSSGKPELYEKYDKNYEHYICRKFFYENGNVQSVLEMKDSKNLIYIGKEYYENGSVREEGNYIYNPNLKDYLKFDNWKVFDDKGRLIADQYFVNGSLYSQKKYN
jgi:antitoxin component YwqK of YwqJK toxin-antitoxin module